MIFKSEIFINIINEVKKSFVSNKISFKLMLYHAISFSDKIVFNVWCVIALKKDKFDKLEFFKLHVDLCVQTEDKTTSHDHQLKILENGYKARYRTWKTLADDSVSMIYMSIICICGSVFLFVPIGFSFFIASAIKDL